MRNPSRSPAERLIALRVSQTLVFGESHLFNPTAHNLGHSERVVHLLGTRKVVLSIHSSVDSTKRR
jgi:hypothetical protein